MVSKALMVVAAMWAFVLAFYILIDVIARNIDLPIEGTSEIVTNSIVVVVFLQLAYCVHIRGMLRADFLLHFMGPRLTRTLNVAGYLLCAVFFGALVYGSYDGAWTAWVTNHFEGDGALRVPTWPARFAVLLGCGLAAINYVLLALAEIGAPQPDAAGPAV
jgi:TRAP-type C4-dicarboxylate transport system permease small subunit